MNERTCYSGPSPYAAHLPPPHFHSRSSLSLVVRLGDEGNRAKPDKGKGRSCTSSAPASFPLTAKPTGGCTGVNVMQVWLRWDHFHTAHPNIEQYLLPHLGLSRKVPSSTPSQGCHQYRSAFMQDVTIKVNQQQTQPVE